MISVSNVTFGYDRRHKVLQDFSLQFRAGGVYGLLGKNGTGKSTLLYLMMGLLRARRGEVTVDGVPAFRREARVMQEMFLVPEEYDLPACSLRQYVDTLRPFYPRFSDETLERCLQGFEMPLDIDLSALSMGQKKKVYVCVALATGTRYLLMDEPTNGLDILSKSQFRKVVISGMTPDKTVIISTHQVHDVEHLLSHVCIIDQSRVLLNAPLNEDNGPVDLEKLFVDVLSGKELTEADGVGCLDGRGVGESLAEEPAVEASSEKPAWRKFLDVARWDLTTNRRFYLRAFGLMAACMVVPVLFAYLGCVKFLIDGTEAVERFVPSAEGIAITLGFAEMLFSLVILGYTFHNLSTKQGRVSELTLPASNGQRFLWHVLFALVGGQIAIMAAVVLTDFIHFILVLVLFHNTSDYTSLTLTMYDYPILLSRLWFTRHPVFAFSYLQCLAFNFKSTFVLVGAWKYKHNMLFTILAHLALWMGTTVLLGVAFTMMGRYAPECLTALLKWDAVLPEWVMRTMAMTLALLLLAGIWALTYRLYCRAQITTQRNR